MMHRCPCGAAVEQLTTIYRGECCLIASPICDRCRADCDAEHAALEAEFEALIAQGCDKRMADRIMLERVNQRFDDGTYLPVGAKRNP